MEPLHQAFKRLRVLLIIIVTISAVVISFQPALKKRAALVQRREQLLSKMNSMEAEIKTLRQRELALQSDKAYLEKMARNKMGYSRPGETLYKFD
jgi:cell division protein FtsB